MKKINLGEKEDGSIESILKQMGKLYENLESDRNFDPEKEIFKLFIKQKEGETDRKFRKRQNRRIRKFVETRLWFLKKGERQKIKLINKHCEIIADLFYKRKDLKTGETIQAIIVWANRGGGKSFVAAITIFLCLVWRKMSFIDLAGSAEQALEVYMYVTEFWNCFPIAKEKLLVGEPLQTKTELKNKVTFRAIANSQNTSRGKHPEGLVADEACQKERYKDENLQAATNSVLTQEGFIVFYLSTFHIPTGIFADTWDYGISYGFKRYKWNIFDCLKKCTLDIDCKKCVLTKKKEKKDSAGKVIKTKWSWCNGKGRKAVGWLSIEQVLKMKRIAEIKGENWEVEFVCRRPTTQQKVYKTRKVEKSLVNRVELIIKTQRAVGLDWGTSQQCSIILGSISKNALTIPWSDFSTDNDLDYIVARLRYAKKTFGDFVVYADAEQTYGIKYLRKQGFVVESIPFNKYKMVGIQNIGRYFNSRRIRILNNAQNRILYKQLIDYRYEENGKPRKVNDHGPDALMCLGLRFDFTTYFARDMHRDIDKTEEQLREEKDNSEVLTF